MMDSVHALIVNPLLEKENLVLFEGYLIFRGRRIVVGSLEHCEIVVRVGGHGECKSDAGPKSGHIQPAAAMLSHSIYYFILFY